MFHTQKYPLIERFNRTLLDATPTLASKDPSLVKVVPPQFAPKTSNVLDSALQVKQKPKFNINDRIRNIQIQKINLKKDIKDERDL